MAASDWLESALQSDRWRAWGAMSKVRRPGGGGRRQS